MRVTATLGECRTCRIPTVRALCDGLEVTCELLPLSREGEIAAAIAGRKTYRLDADRRLWRNDQWRISRDAPMPGDHRLVAHVCDRPVPAAWRAPEPIVRRPEPIVRRPDPNQEPQW